MDLVATLISTPLRYLELVDLDLLKWHENWQVEVLEWESIPERGEELSETGKRYTFWTMVLEAALVQLFKLEQKHFHSSSEAVLRLELQG
jgi:hypothetical protein